MEAVSVRVSLGLGRGIVLTVTSTLRQVSEGVESEERWELRRAGECTIGSWERTPPDLAELIAALRDEPTPVMVPALVLSDGWVGGTATELVETSRILCATEDSGRVRDGSGASTQVQQPAGAMRARGECDAGP